MPEAVEDNAPVLSVTDADAIRGGIIDVADEVAEHRSAVLVEVLDN